MEGILTSKESRFANKPGKKVLDAFSKKLESDETAAYKNVPVLIYIGEKKNLHGEKALGTIGLTDDEGERIYGDITINTGDMFYHLAKDGMYHLVITTKKTDDGFFILSFLHEDEVVDHKDYTDPSTDKHFDEAMSNVQEIDRVMTNPSLDDVFDGPIEMMEGGTRKKKRKTKRKGGKKNKKRKHRKSRKGGMDSLTTRSNQPLSLRRKRPIANISLDLVKEETGEMVDDPSKQEEEVFGQEGLIDFDAALRDIQSQSSDTSSNEGSPNASSGLGSPSKKQKKGGRRKTKKHRRRK